MAVTAAVPEETELCSRGGHNRLGQLLGCSAGKFMQCQLISAGIEPGSESLGVVGFTWAGEVCEHTGHTNTPGWGETWAPAPKDPSPAPQGSFPSPWDEAGQSVGAVAVLAASPWQQDSDAHNSL